MSELLIKLWQNGILQLGIWETVYMTLISTFFAYLIGLPVGLILRMTDRDGIHPIGWKMFDSNSHTAFICSLHIFQGKIQHLLWITSKSSYIGNGIVKIIINIHNRRKRPVQPQSCTLFAGGISHSVSIFRIICSRHCHRFSEGSSLIGKSVSACFRISRK